MKTVQLWFTPMAGETIGIVLKVDSITNEDKAYIGHCNRGNTEQQDIKRILEFGAKFPLGIARNLMGADDKALTEIETKGKSQVQIVRAHLERYGSITSMTAFVSYKITRLSHIIYVLREVLNIKSVMEQSSKKKRYARYKLITELF